MKNRKTIGLIVCILLALFTGNKLLKMFSIRGWVGGARVEMKVITGKAETQGRYGPAYFIAWDNESPSERGHHRVNLEHDHWASLSVNDEIEVRYLGKDPMPYLSTGIFASSGNFVFDFILFAGELGGILFFGFGLLRQRFSKPLVVFVAITSLACVTTSQAKEPRVKDDRLVFALPDLDGNIVKSSDARFEGKVLFVTLWGTWCPPCRSEIPTFNDLQDRYVDDGLVIVGIAFERDTLAVERQDRLRQFSQKNKINYLVLDGGATSDFSSALPMVENAKGLPIEIMIDRSGVVIESRNGYGYKEKWARELERDLKAQLLER